MGETATLVLSATVLSVETGESVTVTASIPDGPADSASFTGIGGCRLQHLAGVDQLVITGSVNMDDVTDPYTILLIETTGTITGGTIPDMISVDNRGTITGGTSNGVVTNTGTITGGTFNGNLRNSNEGRVQGRDANALTINGAIY